MDLGGLGFCGLLICLVFGCFALGVVLILLPCCFGLSFNGVIVDWWFR